MSSELRSGFPKPCPAPVGPTAAVARGRCIGSIVERHALALLTRNHHDGHHPKSRTEMGFDAEASTWRRGRQQGRQRQWKGQGVRSIDTRPGRALLGRRPASSPPEYLLLGVADADAFEPNS
ncbi:hypothetical protein K443DRAFT_9109 [Laccaria amethystina LaAM-08-1]|uniref:Unplaced genomic scaffold K443scaffold_132, whole genome shotgun sequence n=1 Tax=Laccaria amethystina LaAM-08-1 TaxID=1095629 RepID=A0A0C9XRG6_9AGAR|nr:hypothetical protein K443DRAFT_9109 [Laccaria amethystina LaAM-08-1]